MRLPATIVMRWPGCDARRRAARFARRRGHGARPVLHAVAVANAYTAAKADKLLTSGRSPRLVSQACLASSRRPRADARCSTGGTRPVARPRSGAGTSSHSFQASPAGHQRTLTNGGVFRLLRPFAANRRDGEL